MTAAMKLKDTCSLEGKLTNLDRVLKSRDKKKSRDITLLAKVRIVKAMVFPVATYGCWKLDHKEGWGPKNWGFWTEVLEKTFESPLDSKEINPVNPKRNQSWIFIGRTDAEAETPVLWPHDAKSQLIGKDPDVGKDWGQEEKGVTEDETVKRHHRLNGHEFEQTPGAEEPGVLQSMGSQKVRHDFVTKQRQQNVRWR